MTTEQPIKREPRWQPPSAGRLFSGAAIWSALQLSLTVAAPEFVVDGPVSTYGVATTISLLLSWLFPIVVLRAKIAVSTILVAATSIGIGWLASPLVLFGSPVRYEEAYSYYFALAGLGAGVAWCQVSLNALRSFPDRAIQDSAASLAEDLRRRATNYRKEGWLSLFVIFIAIGSGAAIFSRADNIAARNIDQRIREVVSELEDVQEQHRQVRAVVDSADTLSNMALRRQSRLMRNELTTIREQTAQSTLISAVSEIGLARYRLDDLRSDLSIGGHQATFDSVLFDIDLAQGQVAEMLPNLIPVVDQVAQARLDSARSRLDLARDRVERLHSNLTATSGEPVAAAIDSARFEVALSRGWVDWLDGSLMAIESQGQALQETIGSGDTQDELTELDTTLDRLGNFLGIDPDSTESLIATQLYDVAQRLADESETRAILSSLSTRIGSVLLIVFLVQILAGLYRYSARMAAHHESRADVLSLKEDERQGDAIGLFSTGHVDFGKTPEAPTSDIKDLLVKIVEAIKTRR